MGFDYKEHGAKDKRERCIAIVKSSSLARIEKEKQAMQDEIDELSQALVKEKEDGEEALARCNGRFEECQAK